MRPVVLIILDGWGFVSDRRGNAIALARTPTFDMLEQTFPFGYLQASGISVGLPWNEPGNSEVGHLALGTGRIIDQALSRIEKAIQNESFFKNPALLRACEHVKQKGSALHLAGLFGSGSVHSYLDHLYALLEFAKRQGVERVYLHLFLDGRDSPPKEGAGLLTGLVARLNARGEGTVATVIGRHYGLDRTLNWERTARAYHLITQGEGAVVPDLPLAVRAAYEKGLGDEFMEPLISVAAKEEGGLVKKGDALVFFEFREDSARQITYCFATPEKVSGFSLTHIPDLLLVTMTEYEKGLPVEVAFPTPSTPNTLSELISRSNKKQIKIAESEKYAHVTYFFNGGVEAAYPGEVRQLIPSEELTGFESSPEMQAPKIGEELKKALGGGEYAFILANFANADMLGHTGNLNATIQAVEAIDSVMAAVVEKVTSSDAAMVITADHGNAEMMINLVTGAKVTEHSSNPVPFYIVGREFAGSATPAEIEEQKRRVHGVLPDVTATVLTLMGMEIPKEMQGRPLIPRA